MCVCVYIYIYIHPYVHTYLYTHTHTHTLNIHILIAVDCVYSILNQIYVHVISTYRGQTHIHYLDLIGILAEKFVSADRKPSFLFLLTKDLAVAFRMLTCRITSMAPFLLVKDIHQTTISCRMTHQ